MSPLPVQMEDHWSLHAATAPERARVMWLMLVGDHPEVAELARLGQQRLRGLGGLDLVPRQWLHVTTLIAGFAEEIAPDQVDAIASHARRILARTAPITVTLGRILYHPRAIMLDAGPAENLEPVLRAAREATREVTGRSGELYSEPWTPHITLAYSNAAAPAGPVIQALGRQLPRRQIAVASVSLVSQAPDQMWTWHPLTHVPFGAALPRATG
jgi:2'-5' RNA ligase